VLVIVCMELAIASFIASLIGVMLSEAPSRRRGSGPQSLSFLYPIHQFINHV
jgi:hypothetical protein